MNCGSQILIFFAVGLQIRQNITLVAYCPDRQNITLVALRQRYATTRPNNSGTYSKKTNRHDMIVEK